MRDSRETHVVNAFVVGWPIKHSRSPLIHNYWLQKLALSGEYRREAVSEADFPAFVETLKTGRSSFIGGNVTIPHKEAAFAFADCPDVLSSELGAANTLWIQEGRLHATNTDGYGFNSNLDERCPGWDKARRAVILGAGGASRAVIQAVRDRGFGEIHVINRTVSRAKELANVFGSKVSAHGLDALSEVMTGAGLFVNTTSLGMEGGETLAIDFSPLASDALVTDIVYAPLKTPLLRAAEAQGFKIVDGLGMLLHQAVPGFEKWFGHRPEVDQDLRDLVIADLEAHS
jgi:shikimate dehydrogenase